VTIREIEEIFEMIGLASEREKERFLKMAGQFESRNTESEQVFIRIKGDTTKEGGTENA
jgi:hypothetical protein